MLSPPSGELRERCIGSWINNCIKYFSYWPFIWVNKLEHYNTLVDHGVVLICKSFVECSRSHWEFPNHGYCSQFNGPTLGESGARWKTFLIKLNFAIIYIYLLATNRHQKISSTFFHSESGSASESVPWVGHVDPPSRARWNSVAYYLKNVWS